MSITLRVVLLLVALGALGACSRETPPAVEDAATLKPEVTPAGVDLRTLELDEVPSKGALPGMWVRCAWGFLSDGERRYDACLERSQTWVDVADDRVALVVVAANAEDIEVEGKKQRFVDGRARIEVDLRALMARVPADEVADETRLGLQVLVRGDNVVAGSVELVTPRVIDLLRDVEKTPLVFPQEELRPLPDVPLMLVLGPGAKFVRAAPTAPLAKIDVIAIDHGATTPLPPCEGSDKARSMRPVVLTLVARQTGKVLGERRWPGAVAACREGDTNAVPEPTRDEIMAGVLAVLAAGKPSPWVESEVASEALRTLDSSGLEADLKARVDAAEPKKAAVHAFWRLAGLDPNSLEKDVVALVGAPTTRTSLEAGDGGERVLAQWPGGLAVVFEGGRVTNLTFSGATATKAFGRESGVPAVVGQDVSELLALLGRPSAIEGIMATMVMSWVVEASGWTLSVQAEMASDGANAPRCSTLGVKWARLAGDPALTARLGFDPSRLAPLDPEVIKRLATFIGIGPETDKAGLTRAFGKPTNITQSAGGIESYAFGTNLGALVDAASGKVIEMWIVGAAGRDTLKSKQLDDPLLMHIGRPLKDIAAELGRPTKIGDGFASWTVEAGPLTIYLEVQCAPAGSGVCNELDVGWLKSTE